MRFLAVVDLNLDSEESIVIIGGAAAVLAHGATRATVDIDAATQISPELQRAFSKASESTGLNVPVSVAGVFDGPYHFEDRLCLHTEQRLERLSVFVPEKHDLALMKVVRGYEHDLQVIQEMHRRSPLDESIMVGRFIDEMKHVTKPGPELKLNFLALIERLFGTDAAERVDSELADWTTV